MENLRRDSNPVSPYPGLIQQCQEIMKYSCVNNTKKVWFLRHGKTGFDYENCSYKEFMEMLINGGHIPLMEEDSGIDFSTLPNNIDLICHSSAQRAVDTAKKLKNHLNIEKIVLLESLNEVKFDKSIIHENEFNSLKDSRLIILTRWFNNENKEESFKDSLARVKQIELFLDRRPEKNIMLVTHGWFLRLLDIYFVQGKHEDILLSDLLEVKPMALGESAMVDIY